MDMRWCFAVLFSMLTSCMHEEETTPLIHVVPGAAARALWYDMPSSRLPPSDLSLLRRAQTEQTEQTDVDPSEENATPVQKTVATDHPVD